MNFFKSPFLTVAEKSKDAKDGQPEPDIGVQEKAEKDKLLDELMGKPVQKEENAPNPSADFFGCSEVGSD